MNGRAGSVLAWIANSITHHSCLVNITSLSSNPASLNVFLGIIPSAAAIVQK